MAVPGGIMLVIAPELLCWRGEASFNLMDTWFLAIVH